MNIQEQIREVYSEDDSTGVGTKNKTLKRLIITHLDENPQSTVTDINRELNISVPKVINLVNELIEDGFIKDFGKVSSTGGRRANTYGLNAKAGYFLGVDVLKHHVNIGLLDFTKEPVTIQKNIPYDIDNTKKSLKEVMGIIQKFIDGLQVPRSKILGMGVNLSGRVNSSIGQSYSYFDFFKEPLGEVMEKEFDMPVFLENDSRGMVYGEYISAIDKKEKNVLFINMDYGLGLGIVTDGKIFYGKSGFCGELGHIPFWDNEILCYCGKKGCLETEASGYALLRLFKEKLKTGFNSQVNQKIKNPENILLEDIVDAAINDDTLAIELLAEVGEKIGKGVAALVNIFNPELIVLGGLLSKTGDFIRLPVKSALNKYSLSIANNDSKLIISKLGDEAGLTGVALVARNKVLS